MASSTISCNFTPYSQTKYLSSNPTPCFAVVVAQHDQRHLRGLQWSSNTTRNKRNVVFCASDVPPEDAAPAPAPVVKVPEISDESDDNPFVEEIVDNVKNIFSTNFAPFVQFKDKLEDAVEQVEVVVNAVENIAGEIDKAADKMLEEMPEGKLKDFVDYVEDIAENTAEGADVVGDLIDKVQEMDDKFEAFVDSLDDKLEDFLEKKLAEDDDDKKPDIEVQIETKNI